MNLEDNTHPEDKGAGRGEQEKDIWKRTGKASSKFVWNKDSKTSIKIKQEKKEAENYSTTYHYLSPKSLLNRKH